MCNEIADYAERACNSLSLCQGQSKGVEHFFLSPSLNNSLPELTKQEPNHGLRFPALVPPALFSPDLQFYLIVEMSTREGGEGRTKWLPP